MSKARTHNKSEGNMPKFVMVPAREGLQVEAEIRGNLSDESFRTVAAGSAGAITVSSLVYSATEDSWLSLAFGVLGGIGTAAAERIISEH